MKIFLDTANIQDIRTAVVTGLIDGVTTNPSLIAKEGLTHQELIRTVANLVPGPVSAEVLSLDTAGMLDEARTLRSWAANVVIKLPTTWDGIVACKQLSSEGCAVNMTLCFSTAQALIVAKAGAAFCSPFLGRVDDLSYSGLDLLSEIVTVYEKHSFATEVLAASIRSPRQVVECALSGAHVCTMPAKVFHQLFEHPLTDRGLEIFAAAK